VYLEHLTAIDNALAHGGRGKRLNRDKIGEFVLAFDESKQMLGVVATEKVRSLKFYWKNLMDMHPGSFYYISLFMMTREVSRLAAVRLI
jgi:hypothetical protein